MRYAGLVAVVMLAGCATASGQTISGLERQSLMAEARSRCIAELSPGTEPLKRFVADMYCSCYAKEIADRVTTEDVRGGKITPELTVKIEAAAGVCKAHLPR